MNKNEIDLRAYGIDREQAEELRNRFASFAEDWNAPEMDVYDDYVSMPDWEEQETEEVIAAVRRSDQAAAEGRIKTFQQFAEDKRAKFGFSASWPYNVEAEEDHVP